MRRVGLLALVVLVSGCGSTSTSGRVTVWITRDRGAHVLHVARVPAGLTAMQALERARKVTTRYGGRFVQSIDGIDGSATKQRDWFYFVDGIEGDRSAAEVTLQPGDVEWWDYRNWTGSSMSVPVVVGAYPKPFVGRTTTVVPLGVARTVAAAIARQVQGTVGTTSSTKNSIVVSTHFAPDRVRISRVRSGFRLELGQRAARRLAGNQAAFRYRYGDSS